MPNERLQQAGGRKKRKKDRCVKNTQIWPSRAYQKTSKSEPEVPVNYGSV